MDDIDGAEYQLYRLPITNYRLPISLSIDADRISLRLTLAKENKLR